MFQKRSTVKALGVLTFSVLLILTAFDAPAQEDGGSRHPTAALISRTRTMKRAYRYFLCHFACFNSTSCNKARNEASCRSGASNGSETKNG